MYTGDKKDNNVFGNLARRGSENLRCQDDEETRIFSQNIWYIVKARSIIHYRKY